MRRLKFSFLLPKNHPSALAYRYLHQLPDIETVPDASQAPAKRGKPAASREGTAGGQKF